MPPKKKSSSSKSKEKKLKRKQEQAEVAAALSMVKAACDVEDHMKGLPAFQRYTRNELDLSVTFYRIADMTKENVQWAFDLMKECVEALYISGGWGWNDRKKWDELTHDSACFLIARDSRSGKAVGFVNFRFDLDDSMEVVYCYEIHLSPDVRRKGLGKFLMQILELIGHRAEMKKIVLTIFKENTVSNAFFRDKMKYVDDETSPLFYDPLNEDEYTYSILSKTLAKKPAKPVAGAAKPVKRATSDCNEAQQAKHEGKQRTRATSTEVQTNVLDSVETNGKETGAKETAVNYNSKDAKAVNRELSETGSHNEAMMDGQSVKDTSNGLDNTDKCSNGLAEGTC